MLPTARSEALPAVKALRLTLRRIFGNLTAHAERDFRIATSMMPRLRVSGRLDMPLPRRVADGVHRAPELAEWANSPASATRKLLIVKPHLHVQRVHPPGWQTAEILTQSIPTTLHDRPTIVLHYRGGYRGLSMLLPTLIMQLVDSPVFNASPYLRLRNGPPGDLPEVYDLQKFVQRDQDYLMRTMTWLLLCLRGEATVYCAIDGFGQLKRSSGSARRDEMLWHLFALVRWASESDGRDIDFRLLIVDPCWQGNGPVLAQEAELSDVLDRFGLVSCERRSLCQRVKLATGGSVFIAPAAVLTRYTGMDVNVWLSRVVPSNVGHALYSSEPSANVD